MTPLERKSIIGTLSRLRYESLRELRNTKRATAKAKEMGRVQGYTCALRLLGVRAKSVDADGKFVAWKRSMFGVNEGR